MKMKMKKVHLILISILTVMSCDTEPIDPAIMVDTGNGNGNPPNGSLTLRSYSYNVSSTDPIFGNMVVNTDFNFNAQNRVSSSTVTSTFFGQSITEQVTYTRNSAGQVTGYSSTSGGSTTNSATVSYTNGNITQITYDYVGDDEDDYTYNFQYSGNTITRTEVGSDISTVFTLNGAGQLIKKQSFDGSTVIKTEVLDYDGQGNCVSSTVTGEDATTSTYIYDNQINPLKNAFSDQYMLSFLNDDYSDQAGPEIAQFASTNNWTGLTTPEGTINFTIQYDPTNRITNRNGSYDLGNGIRVQQSETLNFVN